MAELRVTTQEVTKSNGLVAWCRALHPGEILALCGLLTFWSRIVGAFHWAYFATSQSERGNGEAGSGVGFLNEIDGTASRLRVFGQMVGGLGTILLMVALGSLWAWEVKKALARLAFWRTVAFSAAVGLLIHLARLAVGSGDGRPPIDFTDLLNRLAEVVLYLGILVVVVKRHRGATPVQKSHTSTDPTAFNSEALE